MCQRVGHTLGGSETFSDYIYGNATYKWVGHTWWGSKHYMTRKCKTSIVQNNFQKHPMVFRKRVNHHKSLTPVIHHPLSRGHLFQLSIYHYLLLRGWWMEGVKHVRGSEELSKRNVQRWGKN